MLAEITDEGRAVVEAATAGPARRPTSASARSTDDQLEAISELLAPIRHAAGDF